MRGKIVKGIAGFYYVHTDENGLYECKAKGVFRNKKLKPLVGDNVEIAVLDEEKKLGNIEKVEERKNSLIRPAVANIDQVIVIFASAKPAPNLNLLDRFLVTMEQNGVDTVICFNKCDLISEEEQQQLSSIYEGHYKVLFTSVKENIGIDVIEELLENNTTVFAGPSGVGKSSMINRLMPHANMETGQISQKIERGKHTTRHSELFEWKASGYIMDTPGFTSLYVTDMEKEELRYYYPEFVAYEGECKFQGCVHVHEPGCQVKEAVKDGKIPQNRYDNYVLFFEELKDKKKTYK